jgi:Domain of unknown function (DUF1877)
VGMYLELTAVSDATIERLHADPPLVWQLVAPDEPERVAAARADARPRPGLVARFLGRTAPPPEPEPPPLELAPGEGNLGQLGDMDKMWHGVHYLLTGTAWEGQPPLNFLLGGGREIQDIEVGQAPVLTHTSAETRAIAAALAQVSDEELRARYDPAEMMRLEIYPEVWGRTPDVGQDSLFDSITALRELLGIVVGRGYGLMVTIT